MCNDADKAKTTGRPAMVTSQAGSLTYETGHWYDGVTRYQWLVLLIASAGWVFDVYEGQIFNITRDDLLSDVLGVHRNSPQVKYYGDVFLGIFLAGGTLGGIAFGSLADRWGRRPVMMLTIVCYSVFSGLTYFADSLWQAAVLRFLVAVGVGGEWAVAAALVSEVFPPRARAQASGIFHASSILGTWLAAQA
jgi:MFS family permease